MTDLKRQQFINPSEDIISFSLRAAAIIRAGDKFLLVQNEGETKYKHPGGHIQTNESLVEGLKRELREEVGITDIELPEETSFYDQVLVGNNLMINAYFELEVAPDLIKKLVGNTPLPSKLFKLAELNTENSWESEIRAIRKAII